MDAFADTLSFGLESSSGMTTSKSIKSIFDFYFRNHRFDSVFLKTLLGEVTQFETRNEEHISFLGSNLLGIHKIKYLTMDEDIWIDEVLQQPEWGTIEGEIHDLPTVNKSFRVAGSILNMSYVYATHRVLTSKELSKSDSLKGAIACMKMFQYKHFASVINYFFPFKTQETVAMALYESLTKKSLLKKYGSWGKMIEARAEDIISPVGIHHKTLTTMLPDKGVLYVITDTQSRAREIIKKLNTEYRRLKDEDSRIVAESRYMSTDDGDVLRDYENKTDALVRDTIRIVQDKIFFIRDDLVAQILRMVPTADERYLRMTLEELSRSTHGKHEKATEDMVRSLVTYMLRYYRTSEKKDRNLIALSIKLRNMFRSSQVVDEDIAAARSAMGNVVERALPRKPPGIVSGAKISALLYLCVRVLVMRHYQ